MLLFGSIGYHFLDPLWLILSTITLISFSSDCFRFTYFELTIIHKERCSVINLLLMSHRTLNPLSRPLYIYILNFNPILAKDWNRQSNGPPVPTPQMSGGSKSRARLRPDPKPIIMFYLKIDLPYFFNTHFDGT